MQVECRDRTMDREKCPVGPVGLVENRNMRLDLPLLDQPGQVCGRAIGAVSDKVPGRYAKASGGSIDHGT